ncbi:hypothetical protein BDA99DRAFT_558082 [Phascolomyces articulosus]|uniref:Uncharacterized protein n=1 Tax=Phascolomyces articulosus TaxID=60185 RepID=A0AAD5PF68_9FUNG|nr:hypothetical protein BDA99DRAFT_558082 [Phascolomyces articulosus]
MDSNTVNKSSTSTSSFTMTTTTRPFEQPVNHHSNGFCPMCGVDVARFSHEFWCRYGR